MKKLLVKAEFIITPYSPAIPFSPEKWVKDGVDTYALPEAPEEYEYHPAIEAKDEVAEVKEWRVIDQTQGPEEELHVWLSGNVHKYPEGYTVEWIDLTEEFNRQKAIQEKIDLGKRARAACESVLDLISGLNLDRALTVEQITQMQATFSSIEKALQSNRPSLAKALIMQVEVDGVIVTQDMKDMSLELLAEF